MTKEEKLLLLQDLCGRLPYKVKGLHREQVHTVTNIEPNSINPIIKVDSYDALFPIEMFKPYLRPMSSMTEEEKIEATKFEINNLGPIGFNWNLIVSSSFELVNWLNAHHFDYRGLIEKGLALEAHEGMYNTKTE